MKNRTGKLRFLALAAAAAVLFAGAGVLTNGPESTLAQTGTIDDRVAALEDWASDAGAEIGVPFPPAVSPTTPPPTTPPPTSPPPVTGLPSCAPNCTVNTTTVTVNVPGVGNRTVTVKYPTTTQVSPLIVAGHGSALTGVDSANQNQFLAKAGYILAAPSFGNIVSRITEGATVVKSVITYLDDLTTGPIGNKVDTTRVGYIGTSMGGMIGYALMRPAYNDPRIDAFVLRAASSSGSEALVTGPALIHMHGTADTTVSYSSGQTAYNRASSPKAWVRLQGATHSLNVSGPLFTEGPLGFYQKFLLGDNAGLARLNAAVAATSSATMTTAW